MLKKLFKYDVRSIWRYFWLIAVAVIGLSVTAAFMLHHSFTLDPLDEFEGAVYTVEMLGIVLSMVAIIGSAVVTEVLLFIRFYKNLYSDEGYLTFTLPVTRKQLLFSKTANAMLWTVLHILLLSVALIIFIWIAPVDKAAPHDYFTSVGFQAMGQLFSQIWDALGAWSLLYGFLLLLACVAYLFFVISLAQFAITVGAVVAKRAKVIAGIGIWYGISAAISFVLELVMYLGLIFGFGAIMEYGKNITNADITIIVALIIFIAAALFASLAFMFYFFTLRNMERRLNLA